MARPIKLHIHKAPSGAWFYDLPASMSSTGRKARRTFSTKTEAEAHRSADLARAKTFGTHGRAIHPALAADAEKAQAELKKAGIEATLHACAVTFVQVRKRERASVSFEVLWAQHEDAKAGKSAAYRRTLDHVGKKLVPQIGQKLVCNLTHAEVREALGNSYPTPHGFNSALRSLSPAFSFAVAEGWAKENPCERIQPRDTGRHEIRFLDLGQCRKVIVSCKDFRKDQDKPEFMRRDARGGIAAVALMLFSGVRPGEVERLEWRDLDMEAKTVRVSNRKAKTDRSRVFDMPDTLHAWLATVPAHKRTGKIVPAQWKPCWQAIRREAAISDLQDALRHTFATMHLAAFEDVNATRAIMGHELGDVIFTNYRGVTTKKEALAFWEILPASEEGLRLVGEELAS